MQPLILRDTLAAAVVRAILNDLPESPAYKGYFERKGKPGDADKHIAAARADSQIMKGVTDGRS